MYTGHTVCTLCIQGLQCVLYVYRAYSVYFMYTGHTVCTLCIQGMQCVLYVSRAYSVYFMYTGHTVCTLCIQGIQCVLYVYRAYSVYFIFISNVYSKSFLYPLISDELHVSYPREEHRKRCLLSGVHFFPL
jgi:hypothetical protein